MYESTLKSSHWDLNEPWGGATPKFWILFGVIVFGLILVLICLCYQNICLNRKFSKLDLAIKKRMPRSELATDIIYKY